MYKSKYLVKVELINDSQGLGDSSTQCASMSAILCCMNSYTHGLKKCIDACGTISTQQNLAQFNVLYLQNG